PLTQSLLYAPAHTDLSTLSLHDALPIFPRARVAAPPHRSRAVGPSPREHRGGGHRPRAHVPVAAADRGVDQADVARTSVLRAGPDRKSTRLNSSHEWISYAVFCLKKKTK